MMNARDIIAEEHTTPLEVIRGHMLRLTTNEADVDIVAPMALQGVMEVLAADGYVIVRREQVGVVYSDGELLRHPIRSDEHSRPVYVDVIEEDV